MARSKKDDKDRGRKGFCRNCYSCIEPCDRSAGRIEVAVQPKKVQQRTIRLELIRTLARLVDQWNQEIVFAMDDLTRSD